MFAAGGGARRGGGEQPIWPARSGDPALAATRRRNAPLRRGKLETAGIIGATIAVLASLLAAPGLGVLLGVLLAYRVYRQVRSGKGWIDLTSAILFVTGALFTGLIGGGIVRLIMALLGVIAGVLWIRRFIDDREE